MYYAHLTSVGFDYSVCPDSLLTTYNLNSIIINLKNISKLFLQTSLYSTFLYAFAS